MFFEKNFSVWDVGQDSEEKRDGLLQTRDLAFFRVCGTLGHGTVGHGITFDEKQRRFIADKRLSVFSCVWDAGTVGHGTATSRFVKDD